MKKLWLPFLFLLINALIFSACKKNSVTEQYTETINPVIPDFTTQVNASVNGFITDENGTAVQGATVKGGTVTVTTDQFGYFKINTAAFAKSAGFVQIIKAGYFTGYRTFLPAEGKETFIRLQLIPKTITGNIDAATGGTVTTTDAAKVTLPANAVVNAATNAAYTGTVSVAAHWLNPIEKNRTQLTMPGNLTGVDSAGYLNVLVTYGMLAVELTGSRGELLQIAAGKKASLNFPIPGAMSATAPASIPLWYFDETKGLWKQDGHAFKNGNNYEGEVSHFSFWNCDIGMMNLVNFSAQILDNNLNPVAYTRVDIGDRNGYTDAAGFTRGLLLANLTMEMKIGDVCDQDIFIQNINTSNGDVDLGSIIVNLPQYSIVFKGQVNKCNGTPVTDGYIIISGTNYTNAITINNGQFSSAGFVCPNTAIQVFAIDREASQQSSPQNFTAVAGNNNLGTLSACSPITSEFVSYTIDGVTNSYTLPQHLFGGRFDFVNDSTTIDAVDLLNGNLMNFKLVISGPAAAGSYPIGITSFIREAVTGPYYEFITATINVTSYGLVGNFIVGNFSGTVKRLSDNTIHPITGSINVKRDS